MKVAACENQSDETDYETGCGTPETLDVFFLEEGFCHNHP